MREAERVLTAELLAAFQDYARTQTVFNERLASQVVNHVLDVQTITIPTAGYVWRTYRVAAGSVEVRNLGTHQMTVVAAATSDSAPANGSGVYVVPAGAVALVNIASRQFTLYGTAGDQASYQVFTTGGLSASNWGAVDGGVA